MELGKTPGRRPIRPNTFRRGLALALAGALIGTAVPAGAVARLGGQTDDSVCDVGATQQRNRDWPEVADFIRAKCKNGQLLMGSSVVPAGGFDSEITVLARGLCRIADIQARRTQGNMAGIVMEYDEVRCKLEKLPK